MKHVWDDRYSNDNYVYGIDPNLFLKNKIENLKPGKILFPAEGEGRNAVFAATLGWEVSAFDYSVQAHKKALRLSKRNQVSIDYTVCNIEETDYEKESFDAIALIYMHTMNRQIDHRHLMQFVKPGGVVILEAYSKNQLKKNTGGPKNVEKLFSAAELNDDFAGLTELSVWEENIVLNEGELHSGESSIIRLIGKK